MTEENRNVFVGCPKCKCITLDVVHRVLRRVTILIDENGFEYADAHKEEDIEYDEGYECPNCGLAFEKKEALMIPDDECEQQCRICELWMHDDNLIQFTGDYYCEKCLEKKLKLKEG